MQITISVNDKKVILTKVSKVDSVIEKMIDNHDFNSIRLIVDIFEKTLDKGDLKMSKCENCIHDDVCLYKPCLAECPLYKDKSLFVELPCEWGKDVYTVVKGCKRPLKTKLFAIGVTEDRYTVYNPTEYPKGVFGINGVILGENTFANEKQAEAKLKEIGE